MEITINSTLEDLYQTGKINVRIYNGLLRFFRMYYPDRFDWYTAGNQIKINDICKLSHHTLLGIRNLGKASVTILCDTLAYYGFSIPGYEKTESVKESLDTKPQIMSPAKFKHVMSRISDTASEDEEVAHCKADQLMCELLNSLGYSDGVMIFKQMPKYYS